MKIEKDLSRLIRNEGIKVIAQKLGITQSKLKNHDLDKVDLDPLSEYLKNGICVCNGCKSTTSSVKLSREFGFDEIYLKCYSCNSVEFSHRFVCGCCHEPVVLDLDEPENLDLYTNKICKNCLNNDSTSADVAFVWNYDADYLETMLVTLPKEKQLLIAKSILDICSLAEMKPVWDCINDQKDSMGSYSEDYIEILAKLLKQD